MKYPPHFFPRILLPALALAIASGSTAPATSDPASQAMGARGETSWKKLCGDFQNPPDSAKPQTWWHWMNGNITREGITADLEAMKHVGLGGAQMFDATLGLPAGTVLYGSDEWRALVKHALEEASRLGLEIGMHNCAGWCSSGGPWVTPEYGMQKVVTSATRVSGPSHMEAALPQPPTNLGYYRNIAVLAFPSPPGELRVPADFTPKVTTGSTLEFRADALLDGRAGSMVLLPLPTPDAPQYIQFEFEKNYPARRLVIDPGPHQRGFDGEFQSSDDGVHFKKILAVSLPYGATARTFSFPELSARYYRLFITKPARTDYPNLALSGIKLDTDFQLENFEQKAGFKRADAPIVDPKAVRVPEDSIIPGGAILDLTDKLKPDGTLAWEVPEGHWTILRIGHTATGEKNHPAGPGGVGLECDKLSRKAVEVFWDGMMAKVIADAGPLAGKTLTNVLVDSYEIQTANWTPELRKEFQARRGYDPTKYLPALTGRVVESGEITERFLWDFRRTLADLFAENYSGTLSDLAARHGLVLALEPYGSSAAEDLLYARPAAIPMTEFWSDTNPLELGSGTSLSASAGHIYGHPLIGAESFTGRPNLSGWNNDPRALKSPGDGIYCSGVNRFYFHTFAHQPWTDRAPGMTMGQWGSHFDRTNTWWEQGTAWLGYLGRCQSLLQRGQFVADVLYFCGEGAPVGGRVSLPLPKGFRYDHCNADVILTRMGVKDGQLVLPEGQTYRLLVLPPEREMTPTLLRKIRELVRDGATVVGPKPLISPGLQDYPKCDGEVGALAGEVWGDCDGRSVTRHRFGKGTVIWGENLAKVFSSMNVRPDLEIDKTNTPVRFIHRSVGDTEIYFVANLQESFLQVECTFRVSGKVPEIWDPQTGTRAPAPVYRESDGRTMVPLDLDPSGSVFVVFHGNQNGADHLVSAQYEIAAPSGPGAEHIGPAFTLSTSADGRVQLSTAQSGSYHFEKASGKKGTVELHGVPGPIGVSGPWQIVFPPGRGAPASISLDPLASWTDQADPGVRYFSGTARYKKDLEIPGDLLGDGKELYLDLGEVKNIARIRLNGKDLGILWKPPFRVPIASATQPGTNQLEIEITNLWANRLIGDEQLPADCEWKPESYKNDGEALKGWPQWLLEGKTSPTGRVAFSTWRHWNKDDAPLPSGLLGPVRLVPLITRPVE